MQIKYLNYDKGLDNRVITCQLLQSSDRMDIYARENLFYLLLYLFHYNMRLIGA